MLGLGDVGCWQIKLSKIKCTAPLCLESATTLYESLEAGLTGCVWSDSKWLGGKTICLVLNADECFDFNVYTHPTALESEKKNDFNLGLNFPKLNKG